MKDELKNMVARVHADHIINIMYEFVDQLEFEDHEKALEYIQNYLLQYFSDSAFIKGLD